MFAGNIGVAQSFDTIIDAARILNKKIKELNFIILGDGRDKERVIEKIYKMSLENNFKFLGSFPPQKMSDYFACADALLVSLKKRKNFHCPKLYSKLIVSFKFRKNFLNGIYN